MPTDDEMRKLAAVELYAWIGEDEFGSGRLGLKQGVVPAGLIPIVSVDRAKIDVEGHWPQAEAQAATFGKRIYLCRFQLAEVLRETKKP
jgi:hypothetical protein